MNEHCVSALLIFVERLILKYVNLGCLTGCLEKIFKCAVCPCSHTICSQYSVTNREYTRN